MFKLVNLSKLNFNGHFFQPTISEKNSNQDKVRQVKYIYR